MKKFKSSGVTLIELMVVVILVGILALLGAQDYTSTKKKQEYNSAVSIVRTICGVAKSYFLTQGSYATTTSTANTNTVYSLVLSDGAFNNYRVNGGAGSFTVSVSNGGATYTFNSAGVRISCTGTGCIT